MTSGNDSNLQKGAWGSEEDALLKNCIEMYGEGKWHLVPQRAGLNRCRKSCRLRWLNYLRPSIRRGEFGEDEVDLIIRLHKLLGNRWSLIAGRLPGRTANDVKNFWNTNHKKKLPTASYQKDMIKRKDFIIKRKPYINIAATTSSTVVIKPLPRTLSRGTRVSCHSINSNHHAKNYPSPGEIVHTISSNNHNSNIPMHKTPSPPSSTQDHDGIEWWKKLLAEIEIDGQEEDSSKGLLMGSSSGFHNLNAEKDLIRKTTDQTSIPTTEATGVLEDGQGGWSDIWDLVNSDYN